ncbi:hypothetical protein TrVE_jg2703 [Triparma verrucosa]|uniref:Uncharacterized protein n=1 Tax=Triparma verrucosa TaxID=1606542 RepID=A0A9W7FKC2_9STRA|nr:hypothetical protein TrVE_jg2703 [Triparma verrucosa]|mmetsp:Transcript_28177/g.53334  ORF Transcript_28177/g.53334 Transcript_28177/m.53334 type:complete len:83 (+) Transcript_28177:1-249(+)
MNSKNYAFLTILALTLALAGAFSLGGLFGNVKTISQRGNVAQNACSSGEFTEVSKLAECFEGSHIETDENVNPARKCGFCMG